MNQPHPPSRNVSISREIKIAATVLALFYAGLFVINYLSALLPEPTPDMGYATRAFVTTCGALFGLADVLSVMANVSFAGVLSWQLLKWMFPNTLGASFGTDFDDGWEEIADKDKTKIIIVAFLVIFFAIATSSKADETVGKNLPIPVSVAARDLIIKYEVGSKQHYDAKLQRPEVPAWQTTVSGVTVGFGVDMGHMTKEQIGAALDGHIPGCMVEALKSCSGFKGKSAYYNALPRVRNTVVVPWPAAVAIFEKDTLPRFTQQTKDAFRLSRGQLHPDENGSLLSIVFNRGGSMSGDKRIEMRAIRDDIGKGKAETVPGHIRSMKRLWSYTALKGLHLRRDAEANLFYQGYIKRLATR